MPPMTTGPRKTRLELTWIGKENRPRLEAGVLWDGSENGELSQAWRYPGVPYRRGVLGGRLPIQIGVSASFNADTRVHRPLAQGNKGCRQ
jgi:hypothetical protein